MTETDGSQQYRLRWNNHSASVISEFESLLGQEDFVDVTISCEKRNFKAHRVVLSACSAYFRKLLKDNPCQHPIIILNDVGDKELANILHFMYHGNVMVEQVRIPKLLATAQMLEIRGLCDMNKGSKPSANQEKKDEAKSTATFSGGLLCSAAAAAKRAAAVSEPNPTSTPQPNAAKRLKTSPASSRPIPQLQSILKQQVIPVAKATDAPKLVASQALVLKSLAAKVPPKPVVVASPAPVTVVKSISSASLENLLGSLAPVVMPSSRPKNSAASISSDDVNDREEPNDSSLADTENSNSQGIPDADIDGMVEIKDEPVVGVIEDEFNDDSSMHGSSITGAGDFSESETDYGGPNEGSRGVPLLAQHLSSPNIQSAAAKLRAAVQRSLSNDTSPLPQVISVPSTSPDMSSSSADVDPLGGDMPRKLAFHEPRPCPICRRMYRDAATLRTHTAIMHAEGRDPFACMCGELFRTKYEMYNHKKNGHR